MEGRQEKAIAVNIVKLHTSMKLLKNKLTKKEMKREIESIKHTRNGIRICDPVVRNHHKPMHANHHDLCPFQQEQENTDSVLR